MEYEKSGEINTVQQQASMRVKQIASAMKHFRIMHYLDFTTMSEADKAVYNALETQLEETTQSGGKVELLIKLKLEELSKRYDRENSQLTKSEKLEAYRGAKDAEQQALKTGRIKKAKKCQTIATKYYEQLGEEEQKRAIEYKRGLFSELTIPQEKLKESNEQISQKLKKCIRPQDAKIREELTQIISQLKEEKEIPQENSQIAEQSILEI